MQEPWYQSHVLLCFIVMGHTVWGSWLEKPRPRQNMRPQNTTTAGSHSRSTKDMIRQRKRMSFSNWFRQRKGHFGKLWCEFRACEREKTTLLKTVFQFSPKRWFWGPFPPTFWGLCCRGRWPSETRPSSLFSKRAAAGGWLARWGGRSAVWGCRRGSGGSEAEVFVEGLWFI